MADHFEIREALEPFVVARLAGRLTSEQASRLERNLGRTSEPSARRDIEANVRLDVEFHLLLCEFLGNREITRVMDQIREKVHGVIHHISPRFPGRMAVSLAEHQVHRRGDPRRRRAGRGRAHEAHLPFGLQNVYDRGP